MSTMISRIDLAALLACAGAGVAAGGHEALLGLPQPLNVIIWLGCAAWALWWLYKSVGQFCRYWRAWAARPENL